MSDLDINPIEAITTPIDNTETKSQSIEKVEEETNSEKSDLISDNINLDKVDYKKNLMIETLSKLKDRKSLKSTKNYIRSIQQLIIAMWASALGKDDKRLNDDIWGEETKKWVQKIQKALVTTYSDTVTRESLGCKNNEPDGIPWPKTLLSLLTKIWEKTRLELMLGKLPWGKIENDKKVDESNKTETKTNEELENKKVSMLTNLNTIPWLEKSTLEGIGITFNDEGIAIFPEWLERKDKENSKNFDISVVNGYEVINWEIKKEKDNTEQIAQETLGKYIDDIKTIMKNNGSKVDSTNNPTITLKKTSYNNSRPTDDSISFNIHSFENTGKKAGSLNTEKLKQYIESEFEKIDNKRTATNKYETKLSQEIAKIQWKEFARTEIFPDNDNFPASATTDTIKAWYNTFFNKFNDITKIKMSSNSYVKFSPDKSKITLSIDFSGNGDPKYTNDYEFNTNEIFDANGNFKKEEFLVALWKLITKIVENKDNGYV